MSGQYAELQRAPLSRLTRLRCGDIHQEFVGVQLQAGGIGRYCSDAEHLSRDTIMSKRLSGSTARVS